MKAHTYYIIFGRPPIGGKLPPPFSPGGATGYGNSHATSDRMCVCQIQKLRGRGEEERVSAIACSGWTSDFYSGWLCAVLCFAIDVQTFLRFLILVTFFYVFNVFFIFQTFFIFKKNVGRVQSDKQMNKKHFQNNSNEIDPGLWFFCCMSNDLKYLPINVYLLTMFEALCDGLEGHSWASAVELNYTKKR